ncbi:transglycosylase SLT domain-containing protein [Desulfobulbus sp. TB]|nr:transglycosylase SLT domain-containing protein [Desulfobulbus sp. TB]
MSINKLVIHLELAVLGVVLVVLLLSALDRGRGNQKTVKISQQNRQVQAEESTQQESQARQVDQAALFADIHVPPREREIWFGDLDSILQRGQLRVLIPLSRTFFIQDNGQELGLDADILRLYKDFINDKVVLGDKKMELIFLPTPQERLIEDLLAGKGDIVATAVQPQSTQEKTVKFISPVALDIQEILMTGPNTTPFKSIFNLSGQQITVHKDSAYAASLHKLNNTLISIGRKPVILHWADPLLTEEDLLEMTATGLVPMTVIDSHVGELWVTILSDLKPHKKIILRTAKELTWGIRADSELLQRSITYFKENVYIPQNSHQALAEYYRKQGGFLKNNLKPAPLERYQRMATFFEQYGTAYRFPSLMLAALAYQESGLTPSFKGKSGAVGVMGIIPSATLERSGEINLKKIQKTEYNIQIAARYLRFLVDHYFSSQELSTLDQHLMALAAYTAGPEQVITARKRAALAGYNPDIWFNHTEAALLIEGRPEEIRTARSVRHIYAYFKAYESFLAEHQN